MTASHVFTCEQMLTGACACSFNLKNIGDVSDDFAQNSIFNRCRSSLHSFRLFWRSTAYGSARCRPKRRDHDSSQLDIRGLLDSVFSRPLSRYLCRPAGQPLYLPRVWHHWQTRPRQVQPDQPSDARKRVLVFIGVLSKGRCAPFALRGARTFIAIHRSGTLVTRLIGVILIGIQVRLEEEYLTRSHGEKIH